MAEIIKMSVYDLTSEHLNNSNDTKKLSKNKIVAGTNPAINPDKIKASVRNGSAFHGLRPEQLAVITCISNPIMWNSRINLYRDFEEQMLDSGVKLVTVECTYGDHTPQALPISPFVNHVRVKASGINKMWIKENLLNLGIAAAFDSQYIAIVDADIIFRSNTWAIDTLAALQHYHVIQPWSYCYDLGPRNEHMQAHRSFCNLYYEKGAVGVIQGPNATPGHEFGHPGYAWAYRREALEWLGGLVETAVLGAADHHMALALINKVSDTIPGNLTDGYKQPLYLWQERAFNYIAGHIGALPDTIEHPWHGAKAKRAYIDRWDILARNKFDPTFDIKRNTYGVLELSGSKPQLSHDIDAYFRSRDEDSNSI